MSFEITRDIVPRSSKSALTVAAVSWPTLRDVRAKWAEHCAASTSYFLQESSLRSEVPHYRAPTVALVVLIERLLRQSSAPLSAALATLALVHWITESGSCPSASSSAHHLFCSAYIVLLNGLWGADDEEWVDIKNYIPMEEVEEGQWEIQEFFETSVTDVHWDMLELLVGVNDSLDELFELQCAQNYEGKTEPWFLDSEELATKGLLKLELGDDDDSA